MATDPLLEEARKRAAAQTSPALAQLQQQLAAARARTSGLQQSTQAGYDALAARAPGQEAAVNANFSGARGAVDAAYSDLKNEVGRLYESDAARSSANLARMGLSAADGSADTLARGDFYKNLVSQRQTASDSALETLKAAFGSSARNNGEIARLSGQEAVAALARQLADTETQFASKEGDIRVREAGLTDDIYSQLLRAQQDQEQARQQAADKQANRKYTGIGGAEQLLRDVGYSDTAAAEDVELLKTILGAHGQKGQERKLSKYIPDGKGGVKLNPEFDQQTHVRAQIKQLQDQLALDQSRGRVNPYGGKDPRQSQIDELKKQLLMGTDDPEILAQEVRYSAQRRNLDPTDTKYLLDALYAALGKYNT